MLDHLSIKTDFGTDRYNHIIRFLDFAFSQHRSGFVELRQCDREKAKTLTCTEYLPLPFDNLRQRIQEMLTDDKKQLISFAAAPRFATPIVQRRHSASALAADVNEIGCIWSDFIYRKTRGGIIGAVELIHNLVLRPSVVISSGDARQIYYMLDESLKNTGLLKWKALTDSLRKGTGSDALAEVGTYLPIPGAVNFKYNPPIQFTICDEQSSWLRYSVEELEDFLSELLQSVSNYNGNLNGNVLNYQPSASALRERSVPANVIEAVFNGIAPQTIPFGSKNTDARFNRDLWIFRTLFKKNFTSEEIKAVFRSNPTGCGDKWAAVKDSEKYLNELLAEASSAPRNSKRNAAKENSPALTIDSMPPGYEFDDEGAVWQVIESEKENTRPKRAMVSNTALRLSEIRENIDSGQISVVITYNYFGKQRSTEISRSQMCNARALVTILSGAGAPVTSNNARQVVSYLVAYENAFAEYLPRKKLTSRLGRGREGKTFFLPGLNAAVEFTAGSAGETAIYNAYAARAGHLTDWVAAMNRLERSRYTIPQIAVLAAFIPPLQKILQIPNFILDIFGTTSSGKSTTLKLAASVYGKPSDPDSLIQQWMNTKLAVEHIAGMCSELPVFLDDAQHCSDDLKRSVIYMIANGKGKGRSSARGGIQEILSWKTVALSTSEEPLHQSSPHEGVRGRLLPVGGLIPPFPPDSAADVQALERIISANHGFAGETFIRHINNWRNREWARWQNRYTLLRSELARNSSPDIIGRVSSYIAAIGVAG